MAAREMTAKEPKGKEKLSDVAATGTRVTEPASNVNEKNQTEIVQTEEDKQEIVQQTLAKHDSEITRMRQDLAVVTRNVDEITKNVDEIKGMLCSFLRYSQNNSQGCQAFPAANVVLPAANNVPNFCAMGGEQSRNHLARDIEILGGTTFGGCSDGAPSLAGEPYLTSRPPVGVPLHSSEASSFHHQGETTVLPTGQQAMMLCPVKGATTATTLPITTGEPGEARRASPFMSPASGGDRNIANSYVRQKGENLVAPPSDRSPSVALPPAEEPGSRGGRPPPPLTLHHHGWEAVGAPPFAGGFPSSPLAKGEKLERRLERSWDWAAPFWERFHLNRMLDPIRVRITRFTAIRV